jgi:hypothetical protein
VLKDDLILSLDNITNSWVADLGDSFHTTPYKKYFEEYVQGHNIGQAYLGDDKPCKIVGEDKI